MNCSLIRGGLGEDIRRLLHRRSWKEMSGLGTSYVGCICNKGKCLSLALLLEETILHAAVNCVNIRCSNSSFLFSFFHFLGVGVRLGWVGWGEEGKEFSKLQVVGLKVIHDSTRNEFMNMRTLEV